MNSHLYSPLDVATWQFRILRLLPGPRDSMIECDLQLHTIIAPPKYIALSYCWGDESDRQLAIVNGMETSITSNLEEALQHLRAVGVELVWIDALCINQNDVQERSLQVRFMKQIYSRAEQTYAWIGPDQADNAALALRFLQNISIDGISAIELAEREISPIERPRPMRIRLGRRQPIISSDGTRNDDQTARVDLEAPFAALLDLFNRAYWQRRWIIQESATSKTTQVMCGETMVSIDIISQALEQCQQNEKRWTAQHQFSQRFLGTITSLRNKYHNRTMPGLFDTILLTKGSLSKDKRDKVFALLGICHDGDTLVPTPNYEESLDMLNINLTKELLRRNSAFQIVLADQRTARHQQSLPSWCPDWLARDLSSEAHTIAERPQRLTLSYGMSACRDDPRKLYVQGLEFGRVVAVTSILDASSSPEPVSPASQRPVQAAQNIRYYKSRCEAAVAACLGFSTWSSQSLGWSGDFVAARLNCEMHILLAVNDITSGYSRYGLQPFWPFLHSWLLANKDFIICGQDLGALTSRRWITTRTLVRLGISSPKLWGAIYKGSILLWTIFTVFLILLMGIGVLTGRSRTACFVTFAGLFGLSLFSFTLWTPAIIYRYIRDGSRGKRLHRARLVVLHTGAIALACSEIQIGDKICLVAGCDSSAILRSVPGTSGEELYIVVGRAFACMSKEDATRYSAFVIPPHTARYQGRSSREKNYTQLIEEYKAYTEWRQFVLV